MNATNKSVRSWLRWLSEQVNDDKVTEVLKERVTAVDTEGEVTGFTVKLTVNGAYAAKILTMKHQALLDALRGGYAEQAGSACVELYVNNSADSAR